MPSLQRRLTAWLLIPLMALWCANAWLNYQVAIDASNDAHDRSLLSSVLAIEEGIEVRDGAPVVDLPYSALEMFESNIQSRVYYRVRMGDGTHITGYEDLPQTVGGTGPDQASFVDARYRGDPVRIATLIKPLYEESISEPLVIQVAETSYERRAFARDVFIHTAARELAMIAIAVFLVWLVVRRNLQPLEGVRQQVHRRASTDLSPIDTTNLPVEIRPLVDAINEQTGNVGRALVAQRQFVSDAAHQFQTPLALLRAQADVAMREPDITKSGLVSFGRQISQLSHLVDQLLLLSRSEGAARVEMMLLDLTTLARRATFDMLPVALRQGVDLGFEGGAAAYIVGNEFLLTEMIENLVDNALRFTPTGGSVTVRVEVGVGKVVLCVDDSGCGIPEEERLRVFDRFYQIAGCNASGSGLGLAIVREIASKHGATATITDGVGGVGASVQIAFGPATVMPSHAPSPAAASKGKLFVALALLLVPAIDTVPVRANESPVRKPDTSATIVKAARKEGRLVIYGTADLGAAGPLLRDFRNLYPQLNVDYVLMSSGEAYLRFRREQEQGVPSADVVWSLAMDLQMKLINDGFAQTYVSPEAQSLPGWAVWRNEAFATTNEPAVLVYNRRELESGEVPRSHRELVGLLTRQAERFKGRVATYHPRKAGVGFLLATQDSETWPGYWELVCRLGGESGQTLSGTSAMLERITSGESLIGYNMSGSYVIARARTDPAIGYVLLSDYTLVLSRIAFIAEAARHPNAARLWVDYLLSPRGQQVMARKSSLYAIRKEVNADPEVASLQDAVGQRIKQVTMGLGLLTYLDDAKRTAFVHRWNSPSESCAAGDSP